jgi:methionine-S-sulfoxide reductase
MACNASDKGQSNKEKQAMGTATSKILLGGGCFWCVEAQFLELEGVEKVVSGYAGGKNANPTYKEVCTGTTGHAEVCEISYDSTKISYEEVLLAFFSAHDPTQLNRQGNDVGTQYRSVVYYANEEEKSKINSMIDKLNKEVYDGKIVTEVSALPTFYEAEDYHQNYYAQNSSQSYCAFVITPKLNKFKKEFKEKLKK